MKVVIYSIQPYEKEPLAKANHKKHDLTFISNPLSIETARFAAGKDAVAITVEDDASEAVMYQLAHFGVKFITTRGLDIKHIDRESASELGIKLANMPASSTLSVAEQTIRNIDLWQEEKCVGNACVCTRNCRTRHATPADNDDNITRFLP